MLNDVVNIHEILFVAEQALLIRFDTVFTESDMNGALYFVSVIPA